MWPSMHPNDNRDTLRKLDPSNIYSTEKHLPSDNTSLLPDNPSQCLQNVPRNCDRESTSMFAYQQHLLGASIAQPECSSALYDQTSCNGQDFLIASQPRSTPAAVSRQRPSQTANASTTKRRSDSTKSDAHRRCNNYSASGDSLADERHQFGVNLSRNKKRVLCTTCRKSFCDKGETEQNYCLMIIGLL